MADVTGTETIKSLIITPLVGALGWMGRDPGTLRRGPGVVDVRQRRADFDDVRATGDVTPAAIDLESDRDAAQQAPPSMRLATLLCAVVLIGCGPMGDYSGLRLGGTEAEVPTSFEVLEEHRVIQLEAWGAILPRVVNLWGVGSGDTMYVWGGDPASGWVKRVAERPDVRVRIGDRAYPLRAERVADVAESERVVAAYNAKYGEDLRSIFGRPATVKDFELIYRLSRRD